MSAISLAVRPRGRPLKGLPESVTVSPEDPADQILKAVATASGASIHRLRVTKGSDGAVISGAGGATVHDTGLRNKSAILVKDLGPQISWRTVFVIEYLGLFIFHPLFYYGHRLFYGSSAPPSQLMTFTFWMCMIHTAKRELETLFLHRFSLATMPARNIVKNSAHYWLASGLNLAFWSYRPSGPTGRNEVTTMTYIGLACFAIGEVLNFYTHVVLRNLRRPGSTDRGIPHGFSFGIVTCPNYMWEILAWVGVWLVNRSWSTPFFLAISAGQMALWAQKKERRYRKEFGDKYKRKRFVMIPGIW